MLPSEAAMASNSSPKTRVTTRSPKPHQTRQHTPQSCKTPDFKGNHRFLAILHQHGDIRGLLPAHCIFVRLWPDVQCLMCIGPYRRRTVSHVTQWCGPLHLRAFQILLQSPPTLLSPCFGTFTMAPRPSPAQKGSVESKKPTEIFDGDGPAGSSIVYAGGPNVISEGCWDCLRGTKAVEGHCSFALSRACHSLGAAMTVSAAMTG